MRDDIRSLIAFLGYPTDLLEEAEKKSADVMIQKEIERLGLVDATEGNGNYYGITDRGELDAMAARFASWRIVELLRTKSVPPFEFSTLMDINGLLFGDLFPTAGMLRLESDPPYCEPFFIEEEGEKTVRKIQATKYFKLLGIAEIPEKLAIFMGDLDALHPFDDGNEASILTFFHMVARYRGFSIDWESWDYRSFSEGLSLAISGNPQPLAASILSRIHSEST